jgi:hypothetical protein
MEISFETSLHSESSGKFLTELVGHVLEAIKDKHVAKTRLYLQILCSALNSTNFHDRAQIWPTVWSFAVLNLNFSQTYTKKRFLIFFPVGAHVDVD